MCLESHVTSVQNFMRSIEYFDCIFELNSSGNYVIHNKQTTYDKNGKKMHNTVKASC